MNIRFGGPTFPERNPFVSSARDPSIGLVKTWFYDLEKPDGQGGWQQTFVYYGEEYPVSRVMNWENYIERGMAVLVESKDDVTGAVASGDRCGDASERVQTER